MTLPHLCRELQDGTRLCYVWFESLHTRVDLALLGDGAESVLCETAEAIALLLRRLEAVGNCYDPESELSRVNREAYGSEVTLSATLFTLLQACQHYHRLTDGLFDIAIDSDHYSDETFSQIHLNENRQITFNQSGIRLNLSGFLKGYALDCIRTELERRHVGHALINMGNSSVMALGRQPGGTHPWQVSHTAAGALPITLQDECLTTSGNDSDQRRHIIHPRSGRYVTGKRALALVTASGAEGEALSTALFAAEPEERKRLVDRFGVERLYLME